MDVHTIVSAITTYAQAHPVLVYAIVFFGSYFDTIVGINFVVRGELFFLSAGILAGAGVLNIWLCALMVFGASILGDHTSYLIGRTWGKKLFKEGRWVFNPKTYQRGEAFFDRFGAKAVLIARLLGPLTWITPFMAGMYRTRYRSFLAFNVMGVFVGVGQFLMIGYLFGANYKQILELEQFYLGAFVTTIVVGAVLIHFFKAYIFEALSRVSSWWSR